MATLIISNEEIEDIMEIVNHIKDVGGGQKPVLPTIFSLKLLQT